MLRIRTYGGKKKTHKILSSPARTTEQA